MPPLCYLLLLTSLLKLVSAAPANGFAFPDERRRDKKLEPVITPPVLPYIEHLERDPSTLLPNETGPGFRHAPPPARGGSNPRFGSGFNVKPSRDGGLTASFSGSAATPFGSQAASQSFSFGFNQGFSASHSASQSASFSSGFGNGGFSGSQASSQAASFSGSSAAAAASSASSAAFAGAGHAASQSAASSFGFNSINGLTPPPEASFGEGLLDIRHRGAPDFFFPPGLAGRSKGVGAATFRSGRPNTKDNDDFIAALFVSD
ncbi:hypothetical protein JYU34_003559 [Plutella xylostella]|uniref:Uncharacterized protein n=1 Tax=Plutella xylostella TaxID=51655 RepID=A0ABQ7R0C8_PLUXY|nr:hypothetical protein JYU34_003559 [Plutella xylostella]